MTELEKIEELRKKYFPDYNKEGYTYNAIKEAITEALEWQKEEIKDMIKANYIDEEYDFNVISYIINNAGK